jgi:hypothetical protein
MDLEPNLGTPVKVVARLQVNIVFEKNEALDFASNLTSEQIYYPMFWFETSTELSQDLMDQLLFLQKVPLFITVGAFLQLAFACCVLTATLIYALHLHKTLKKSKTVQKPARNGYQAVKVVSTTSFVDK